eukprot:TRINITY_DN14209_c3_g1_i2.p2 TRINITY_DN14209_c3_g1~~TRINITY_DN14209_c3_g1_i2.p2  ORF type:complete len:139 (-),score=14.05 TRINITY_DN14209_c3_g1_i2:29-445(-)
MFSSPRFHPPPSYSASTATSASRREASQASSALLSSDDDYHAYVSWGRGGAGTGALILPVATGRARLTTKQSGNVADEMGFRYAAAAPDRPRRRVGNYSFPKEARPRSLADGPVGPGPGAYDIASAFKASPRKIDAMH